MHLFFNFHRFENGRNVIVLRFFFSPRREKFSPLASSIKRTRVVGEVWWEADCAFQRRFRARRSRRSSPVGRPKTLNQRFLGWTRWFPPPPLLLRSISTASDFSLPFDRDDFEIKTNSWRKLLLFGLHTFRELEGKVTSPREEERSFGGDWVKVLGHP